MKISAKIIADSLNGRNGVRLTTFELHYHRYVLPEFNTHRAFSRNGASSRAIPTSKLIEQCLNESVEPLEWGLNQSGMQAFIVADPELEHKGREVWNRARHHAIEAAQELVGLGFAKQIVNRVLEPYLSTRTVVTSTDWANWNALRNHPDAQPEIRELAGCVERAMDESKPKVLALGDWHLPYIMPEDVDRFRQWAGNRDFIRAVNTSLSSAHDLYFPGGEMDQIAVMVSAARCARVSYRTTEGKPTDFQKDLELFQRLAVTQPVHASPTEHQATPVHHAGRNNKSGNFRGWVQFRKVIVGETVDDV